MASPLAQHLFKRAIGESGAFSGSVLALKPLSETEATDNKFVQSLGAGSLEALRAKPSSELLQAALKESRSHFAPNIDGYFLPQHVYSVYANGKQRGVALLAGWNADEGNYQSIFGSQTPTAQNLIVKARSLFGEKADLF